MTGTPAAGDSFAIDDNANGTGDNSNALQLADILNQNVLNGGTESLSDAVNAYVGTVGMQTSQAQNGATAQQSVMQSAQSAQQSVSGVNLDQEAANMLQYQQAYQAAAQVIADFQHTVHFADRRHATVPGNCHAHLHLDDQSDRPLNGILQDESGAVQRRRTSCPPARASTRRPITRSAAVQLLQLNNTNSQYQQYVSNGQSANTNLTLEEQALSTATTTLQSIRIWWSGQQRHQQRHAICRRIATQIQQLEQPAAWAPPTARTPRASTCSQATPVDTQPFVRGSTGSMSYVGDSGASSVPLNGGTSVQTGDPGSAVFMNVPTGNGTFTTAASASNTGTGVIDAGSVTNAVAVGAGAVHDHFHGCERLPGDRWHGCHVVATGTYDAANGGSVAFDGIQVGITGAPAAGDTFTVTSSGTQSVFDTLDNIVSALNNAGSSGAARAQLSSTLGGSLQQIDQAL